MDSGSSDSQNKTLTSTQDNQVQSTSPAQGTLRLDKSSPNSKSLDHSVALKVTKQNSAYDEFDLDSSYSKIAKGGKDSQKHSEVPEHKPPLLKIPSANLLASTAQADIQGLKSKQPLTPDVLHHHANLIAKASLPLVASTPNIPASLPTTTAATESDSSDTTPTSNVADDPASHISFQSLLKEKGLRTTITNRTPRDFFFIKVLGEGSFSTVYFAKEVDTGDDYAIKVLQKSEIRREKKVRYVLREKDVMAALTYAYGGHPFVVKLYCTFQDRERLYFAITYAKHGELLDWLQRLGSFDEAVSLFYAAEILSALEFLHVKCNVIHRDLKPENILVGADWHIMLSDFGTSKVLCGADGQEVEEEEPELSTQEECIASATKPVKSTSRSSFVGTAQYISPEVLKSESVGPECDYWALGAIIFQMISGQPPFRAVNEYQILKKILGLDFQFPDGFPETARDLVTKLLVYKPAERLGSKQNGGIEALKRHNYFKDIDWDNLASRTPPELKPFLPASSGEPAFYSDYRFPENLEPGLNEAALTRLMGLNFGEFEFAKQGDSPTLESSSSELSAIPEEQKQQSLANQQRRADKLELQRRTNKFHRFVDDQLILKAGLIDKKKGLFARRRMFLMTEGPRMLYVDPVNMELRGEVPFSSEMRTEAKNFRTFFVHTPNRTYYLFDPERHAKDWCDAIDFVRDNYFKNNHNSIAGYKTSELEKAGFEHFTVNHKYNFVDPDTGVSTQQVERMWGSAKWRNKKQRGTKRDMLQSYLAEFMCRQEMGDEDPFEWLLKNISKNWPPKEDI